MSSDLLHPREKSTGRFTDRTYPAPSIELGPTSDPAAMARGVFTSAEDIEITGAGNGPEGVYVSVDFEGTGYTVVLREGLVEVADDDGEPVDPGPVLDALTGGDPDSAADALAEYAEVSGQPAVSVFGSELEEDAASCGHLLSFDAASGTATAYSMVRKYTAGVHFHSDGSITRTLNGHTVPVFGPTYGRAAELERWAGQNASRILQAQNSALSTR